MGRAKCAAAIQNKRVQGKAAQSERGARLGASHSCRLAALDLHAARCKQGQRELDHSSCITECSHTTMAEHVICADAGKKLACISFLVCSRPGAARRRPSGERARLARLARHRLDRLVPAHTPLGQLGAPAAVLLLPVLNLAFLRERGSWVADSWGASRTHQELNGQAALRAAPLPNPARSTLLPAALLL